MFTLILSPQIIKATGQIQISVLNKSFSRDAQQIIVERRNKSLDVNFKVPYDMEHVSELSHNNSID